MCLSYLCLLVYNSIALYVGFCLESLEEDLKDVEAWYEMRPVADSESDSELEPTGAKAFWVAEVISPAGQAEIVGSISLGTGELRNPECFLWLILFVHR